MKKIILILVCLISICYLTSCKNTWKSDASYVIVFENGSRYQYRSDETLVKYKIISDNTIEVEYLTKEYGGDSVKVLYSNCSYEIIYKP